MSMRTSSRWAAALCCAAAAAGCGKAGRDARASRAALSGTAPAQLVADLRPGTFPADSSPHGFVVSGSIAFFAADDGSSGFELWRTDGIGATSLVLDLRPGGASSLPASGRLQAVPFTDPLSPFHAGILFAADDGARGTELWFSDGTGGGTRLVADIEPGSGASEPRELTAMGATAYFTAATSGNGRELWKTDGTEGGTQRVRAGTGPTDPGDPTGLVSVGSTLYFAATDATNGTRLWKSNGSSGGTVRVASTGAYAPASLTAFQGQVFFAASDTAYGSVQLWKSNGTALGTMVVGDAATSPTDPSLVTPVLSGPLAPSLYYAAWTGGRQELFSTDGATQTRRTSLAAEVRPTAIATAAGKVFVSATQPATGRELYAWTGSSFVNLVDAAPGGDSNPSSLTDVGGILLFGATEAGTPSLYRSDGQAGPGHTYRVFGSGGPSVGEIAAVPSAAFGTLALLAGGDDAAGVELWKSDGTLAQTSLLADIRPDAAGSSPGSLTAWNGRLYFAADDGSSGLEPWVWDSIGGAVLLADVDLGPQASSPDEFVALGTTLLFTATDFLSGRELRATTDAFSVGASPLADLRIGASSSLIRPAHLTRLGDIVLFAADDGSGNGRELWKTDGTGPGTALVKDICAGGSSSPAGLTAVGSNVWFVADDGVATPPKPYRTDGTAGGTLAADPLNCNAAVYGLVTDPAWFAELGGTAVFSAFNENLYGRELFRFNPGPPACTNLVKDLASGVDANNNPLGSDPVAFAVHQGLGYFGARDTDLFGATTGYALWKTDGFGPGTSRVASVGTLGGGSISSTVSIPNVGQPPRTLLFFVGNDEAHGHELWTSDGTGANTRMVVDANPGPLGSAEGSVLLPLPARGHVLYAADDGASGRELWISNGTALGTRLLHDIRPGAASSNPSDFTALGDLVFFTADDGATGRELWVLDTSPSALDLTPPDPICPSTVAIEATSAAGADPTFAITASDDRGGPVALSYSPASGSHLGFGATFVVATAVDDSGNRAQCTFAANVQDTTAPTLACPADLALEATGPGGADASYVATVHDAVTASPALGYAPASGSTFPLGPGKSPLATLVTVTATDLASNAATCTFTVRVADTTPPGLACPAVDPFEATSSAGAPATWTDAIAVDSVTVGTMAISYDRARWDVFPLGTTIVHATTTDEAGNSATCPIAIRVVDTSAPRVTCPTFEPFEANTFGGRSVTFDATAADSVTASPAIAYDHAQGFLFGIGPEGTLVTATAWDAAGNVGTCAFTVVVQDTTPPVITCPGPHLVVEATGPAGAPVSFDATAVDTATPHPQLSYLPPRGSTFPLDVVTLVTATAKDESVSGNPATCTFDVTVLDRTPPTLVCPADMTLAAIGPAGVDASYVVTATDLVTLGPSVVATPPPSSIFPLGPGATPHTTLVEVVSIDLASNVSTCAFTVTVADVTPPVLTCPADQQLEAASALGADAFYVATAVDAVTGSTVSPSAASGSTFPLGAGAAPLATTVTVVASDWATPANTTACAFTVTVADTTAPALACPPPLAGIEAQGGGMATVVYDAAFVATATDAVTVAPTVVFTPPSGSAFPVGITQVFVSATDEAGNVATCETSVAVQDTLAPEITCPPDQTAVGKNGATVTFPAPVVSDLGTDTPTVVSTAHSGDFFPVGTTTVTFTASDGHGQSSQCTMRVTVTAAPDEPAGGCSCGSAGAGSSGLLGLLAVMLRRSRRRPATA